MKTNQQLSPYVGFRSVFDEFFKQSGFGDLMDERRSVMAPRTNIREEEKAYYVELSIPGFKKEDIEMEIDHDQLIISGQVQADETQEEDKKYYLREFSARAFKRQFELPGNIKTDDIKADYDLGVLTIEIPKNMEEINKLKRKISIG